MAARNPYAEFLAEWLAPLGAIHWRPMMGGQTFYCDGVVFAIAARGTFYLKVDDVTRPRYEAAGSEPFRPFEDQPGTMSYYPPPAAFFDNSDVMADWGREAVEAGRRAQKKKKKR